MKSRLILLAAALIVQSAKAQLLVEHFSYNNGSLGDPSIVCDIVARVPSLSFLSAM